MIYIDTALIQKADLIKAPLAKPKTISTVIFVQGESYYRGHGINSPGEAGPSGCN
jgi:hypothetical protein